MASLSEILNSKAEMKQQRTESRRAEREQLSQMRDGALMAITTNPDLYARFLVLQAAVFVPPRNQNFRGYLMGIYYDVSQTTGRPMKEPEPLAEGSERLNAAFAALLDTAPVGFIENTGLNVPVRYNERECILEINTEYSTGQVFAALATEISFARLHDRGMNRDYDRGAFQLNAESVGFMVCRRFGVECPLPDAAGVQQFYNYYAPDERGKSLDFMRQTARNMGDTVERGIQPRQQEHTASRGSNNRQYGRR